MSNRLIKSEQIIIDISKFELPGDVVVEIMKPDNNKVTLSGLAATKFLNELEELID